MEVRHWQQCNWYSTGFMQSSLQAAMKPGLWHGVTSIHSSLELVWTHSTFNRYTGRAGGNVWKNTILAVFYLSGERFQVFRAGPNRVQVKKIRKKNKKMVEVTDMCLNYCVQDHIQASWNSGSVSDWDFAMGQSDSVGNQSETCSCSIRGAVRLVTPSSGQGTTTALDPESSADPTTLNTLLL